MCGRIRCDCTLNGKQLWGNVYIATSTVEIVDFDVERTTNQSDSDLRVQEIPTTGFANMCGQWKIVAATSSPPPLRVYRYATPMAGTHFKITSSMTETNPGVVKFPNN